MSFFPANDPQPGDAFACDCIELMVIPNAKDLGGFQVRRALPTARRRLVGPFIFFDRMGPAILRADQAIDVRPHPHIGLATVTYLFDGKIRHRDSLGTEMVIEPGDVNLMTAGRGIVHSERTPEELRGSPMSMSGLQTWIALPEDKEEVSAVLRQYRPCGAAGVRHRWYIRPGSDRQLFRSALAGANRQRHSLCGHPAGAWCQGRDPRRCRGTRHLCA